MKFSICKGHPSINLAHIKIILKIASIHETLIRCQALEGICYVSNCGSEFISNSELGKRGYLVSIIQMGKSKSNTLAGRLFSPLGCATCLIRAKDHRNMEPTPLQLALGKERL